MTNKTYVGAIDQGTTGTRFMIFDRGGQVVANAYETHEQMYPEPGWVEHDPLEIWENTQSVVQTALGDADLDPDQLAAIGVTNQRETTLLWDRDTGKPVHNAIVWQDRRTTDRVEQLEEAGKVEDIRAKTGLEADAYFSATKAEWLLNNAVERSSTSNRNKPHSDNADPIKTQRARPADTKERAAEGEILFGTMDSWLIYNLTGNHITDVTNASRTMLFDIHEIGRAHV